MRIACLQFSPQVGDTDNNLNRADAVLNKAKPEELRDLDLLVLPEMAFSGYNFKSLQQIHPFLEPSGSGISSLWARTTALKFNTKVLVGYPEKVDVRFKWPASPEYYDSAIMVNGDGETVLNYRKSFLYKADETWALEGTDGFYYGDIPGLGKTCVGICTDLNPYKFGSPWNAFEFASHALDVQADVLVVSMSWVTGKDSREFSRTLAEPDMETLTYWVQRLEPLIAAELDREIIVIFCNRCGQETESLYAGTSAILGIKDGEVSVYALAGRGTKEFLMADTSSPAFAKLVQTQDTASESEGSVKSVSIVASTDIVGSAKWPSPPPSIHGPMTSNISPSNSIAPPRSGPSEPKTDRPFPKLQIPALLSQVYSAWSPSVGGSPITIPTPEAPSPTPLAIRPKLMIPEAAAAFGDFRKPSPYPHDSFVSEQHRFFGGRQSKSFTPIFSPDEVAQATVQYFWRPSDTLLNMPIDLDWASSPQSPLRPASNSFAPLTPYPGANTQMLSVSITNRTNPPKLFDGVSSINRNPVIPPSRSNTNSSSGSGMTTKGVSVAEEPVSNDPSPPLPISGRRSPSMLRSDSKSANQSRIPFEGQNQTSNRVDNELEDLKIGQVMSTPRRRSSLLEHMRNPPPLRSDSPKSRMTSHNRDIRASSGVRERSSSNVARAVNMGSKDIANSPGSSRPRSASTLRRSSSRARKHSQDTTSSSRPHSRAQTGRRDSSRPHSRSNSISRQTSIKRGNDAVEAIRSRSNIRSQTPRTCRDEARPISRGRQRISREAPPPAVDDKQSSPHQTQQTTPIPRHASITRIQSATQLAQVRNATPDDEIVAIEEYTDPTCELHNQRAASTSAVNARIPSIEDGRAIVGMMANLPPPPPMYLPSQAYQPVQSAEISAFEFTEFRTPSVLGGTVKTTIIDGVHMRAESGVSVMSPAFSVTSVTSVTSVSTRPTSDSSPSNTPHLSLTPRDLAMAQLKGSKRVDTPFPAMACNHCGHVGQFHPLQPDTRQLLGADIRSKRKSW